MKNCLLLLCLLLTAVAEAQLSPRTWVIGAQTTVINADFYDTYPVLQPGNTGFNLVPSVYYAISTNWLAGLELQVGYSAAKQTSAGGVVTRTHVTELGIAPVSRFYIDITPNGRLKLFGMAGMAFQTERIVDHFTYNKTTTRITDQTAFFGGGINCVLRKWMVDVNASAMGLRAGVYRVLGGKK
ncbi:outer membrane beta-barrel protein [Sediminibacterium soli]|uniref:outer membrane beta-barrel protein n=1 Tax=Sediminibacterium soli TaxID=2698829 RepID=UPI00137ADDB0|nr:outer membrane beta-barrel protein [Sediminibacterium soli]NCI47963.1 hypothetical protein [Sediminibacterium soli]